MTIRNSRSYWLRNLLPMGDYEIGIASDAQSAKNYQSAGYSRTTRDDTLRRLTQGPAQAVTIDSIPLMGSQENFAKGLRSKKAMAA